MRAVSASSSSQRFSALASLPSSSSSSSSSRCRVVPLHSCCSLPTLDARHSRSGASASPSGTLSRSKVNAIRSPLGAETTDDKSSLVAAAVSSSSSASTSSSSSSFAPATTAAAARGATALLLLLLASAAVASPEAYAAASDAAAAAASTAAAAAAAASTSTIPAAPQVVSTLADLDPSTAASLAAVLRPLFSVAELLFIVRIVLTWYPAVDGDKLPWAVVIKPTEPFLVGTRKVVPPLAGVDVSPVVWVALLSFVSEILVGPQGILILLSRKVGGA